MNTPQVVPGFKKTNVVMLGGVARIVMAVLQADAANPITYNVCNADDLKGSLHGVSLSDATLVPVDSLSEKVRKNALYFA